MSKTIDGVPDHLTREQYLALFDLMGFTPTDVQELRAAHDGVHVIVFDRDEQGRRYFTGVGPRAGYAKHRIFIPVRDEPTDKRTTRITP